MDVSPSTEVCSYDTDTGVFAKDAQECEDKKSYLICDNMYTILKQVRSGDALSVTKRCSFSVADWGR